MAPAGLKTQSPDTVLAKPSAPVKEGRRYPHEISPVLFEKTGGPELAIVGLEEIRELDVSTETRGSRLSYISAASGLVCVGSTIYVVADDELHLGVFSRDPGEAAVYIDRDVAGLLSPPYLKTGYLRDRTD